MWFKLSENEPSSGTEIFAYCEDEFANGPFVQHAVYLGEGFCEVGTDGRVRHVPTEWWGYWPKPPR